MNVRLGGSPRSGQRDAVHVAVVAVELGEKATRGDWLKVKDGKVYKCKEEDADGILDPFNCYDLMEGDIVYLCLKPDSVVGLSHNWIHPSFVGDKDESEQWLRDFCKHADCPDFDTLMAALKGEPLPYEDEYYSCSYEIDYEYLHFNGQDAHGEIPDEFWVHVENYLGIKMQYKPERFSCSC